MEKKYIIPLHIHEATVFYYRGKSLLSATNCYRDISDRTKGTYHAEKILYDCLPKLKFMISIELQVIRKNKNGEYLMSHPCKECVKLIERLKYKGYHVKKIHYSNNEGSITTIKPEELKNHEHISLFYR